MRSVVYYTDKVLVSENLNHEDTNHEDTNHEDTNHEDTKNKLFIKSLASSE